MANCSVYGMRRGCRKFPSDPRDISRMRGRQFIGFTKHRASPFAFVEGFFVLDQASWSSLLLIRYWFKVICWLCHAQQFQWESPMIFLPSNGKHGILDGNMENLVLPPSIQSSNQFGQCIFWAYPSCPWGSRSSWNSDTVHVIDLCRLMQ